MLAYEKALDWQELFDIAVQQQCPEDDLVATAYRVAGSYSRHDGMSTFHIHKMQRIFLQRSGIRMRRVCC